MVRLSIHPTLYAGFTDYFVRFLKAAALLESAELYSTLYQYGIKPSRVHVENAANANNVRRTSPPVTNCYGAYTMPVGKRGTHSITFTPWAPPEGSLMVSSQEVRASMYVAGG